MLIQGGLACVSAKGVILQDAEDERDRGVLSMLQKTASEFPE